MKFNISKEAFLGAINQVQHVVSSRTTLAILSNVLLKAKDGILELTTTDLDVGVTCTVPCEVTEAGATTLPARRLATIIRELPAEDIEITVEDKQLVIKGRQREESQKDYLHRGIAARQFARSFVLADGMEVGEAALRNGLLTIEVHRVEPERLVRRIMIKDLN